MIKDKKCPGRNAKVSLRKVTRNTVRDICRLSVAENQKCFVAPNSVSIAQAYFQGKNTWFRAIYAGGTPVGFAMIDDNPKTGRYYLWRFMIDEKYQGRGYGKRALALIISNVRKRPKSKLLSLSYRSGDGCPAPFYKKIGFVETGKVHYGERVMALKL
jgi:diamine N-acetyltransferase